ncbi:NYN domain-containing protein [Desulfofalx alkaliphila]|uniref:NYN domain-containing protein n=1 Tax=Desulfofalx alkaliphila TaxID=105483 RepID=UPI0004E10904|nr:NYN domain-containing protein [Desulfofalx alkaliphila]
MPNYYVIDGYNVIHAWPEFENIRETALDHARDKLISIMANFAAATESHVTVVFDAHLVKSGIEHMEKRFNIKVYYTSQGETADALIERLVGELSLKGRVYVATSDWDEQRIIFGRGAYRLTPKELATLIKRIKKETRRHAATDLPAEDYLENRLQDEVRKKFEQWRRS